ncbi:MAG: hypothetical protein AAFV87_18115, partial [Pseudomonadota bacterium]
DRIGSDIFENETQELTPEQTTDRLERGERAISVVADQGDGKSNKTPKRPANAAAVRFKTRVEILCIAAPQPAAQMR